MQPVLRGESLGRGLVQDAVVGGQAERLAGGQEEGLAHQLSEEDAVLTLEVVRAFHRFQEEDRLQRDAGVVFDDWLGVRGRPRRLRLARAAGQHQAGQDQCGAGLPSRSAGAVVCGPGEGIGYTPGGSR